MTRLEYELLEYLARRAGRVVGYAELLAAVWGCERPSSSDRDAVKSTAKRLRHKLAATSGSAAAEYLVCVRGVGYVLREPEPHDDE